MLFHAWHYWKTRHIEEREQRICLNVQIFKVIVLVSNARLSFYQKLSAKEPPMISRVILWNGKLFHKFFDKVAKLQWLPLNSPFVVRYSFRYALRAKILFIHVHNRYQVITVKYIAESLSKICHLAVIYVRENYLKYLTYIKLEKSSVAFGKCLRK